MEIILKISNFFCSANSFCLLVIILRDVKLVIRKNYFQCKLYNNNDLRDVKLREKTFFSVQTRVLHRVQQTLQARGQMREGSRLRKDGAPLSPPPELPLLPEGQRTGRSSKTSQGKHIDETKFKLLGGGIIQEHFQKNF